MYVYPELKKQAEIINKILSKKFDKIILRAVENPHNKSLTVKYEQLRKDESGYYPLSVVKFKTHLPKKYNGYTYEQLMKDIENYTETDININSTGKAEKGKKIIPQSTIINKQPSIKTPYEINRDIEKLIDKKGDNPADYTDTEKELLGRYTGMGATFKDMVKAGETDKYSIAHSFEFYTPDAVVKKMVDLAYYYGFKNGKTVFEPSAGIGVFLKYFEQKDVTTYEINKYAHAILKILYPQATHLHKYLEEQFLTGFERGNRKRLNKSVGDNVGNLKKYDLVIGNPPYGEYKGKFSGLEKNVGAKTFIDYFIYRGLDLTKPGGLLIYIIGAEVRNGGTLWLDKPTSKLKDKILEKADFIKSYRLPEKIFERTGVVSDIVVFSKK